MPSGASHRGMLLHRRSIITAYLALGGVTGSMTSDAALSVVKDVAKSDAPALGYTGEYAFANVILTIAGTLIMLI